jgi:putative peptidoglycan lipid II flippase
MTSREPLGGVSDESVPGGKEGGGGGRASLLVAVGIMVSRLMGLVRQKVFAYYLGTSLEADAFNAAFRIPNLLQNLLGEGVLSASFIPVYARLRARGDDDGRRAVAGAVLGLISLSAAVVVLAGTLAAPWLVAILAPGFEAAQRELTITLVRILFAGSGLLVVSAWCLGVLNSHGKFLLSYASPVIWNAAMIATLWWQGAHLRPGVLVEYLAWGSVVGSALQVAVQWPVVRPLLGAFGLSLGRGVAPIETVIRTFVPAVVGRGAAQLSAYIDTMIASALLEGSMTILANVQTLYMLPVSLFGMSVSAAELPSMAGEAVQGDGSTGRLRARLDRGLGRILFFVLPSAVAFVVVGDAIGALVFQGGRFGRAETGWLWGTLAASAVGLLATTLGRLYTSALYALHDARTPQRIALVRLTVGAILGALGALWVTDALALDPRWKVAALVLGSGSAAWLELALLRRAVADRLGPSPTPAGGAVLRVCAAAAVASAVVVLLRTMGLDTRAPISAALVVVAFGVAYAGSALALRIPEANALIIALRRRA